jgi:catechol 2,3-dioxygenase-like lactoylglutathione lyase family enzyme
MTDRPVLDQFNLVVRDTTATVAFYRRLGLNILEVDPAWAQHHWTAEMPSGITLEFDSIGFASKWNTGWRQGMGVLGFRVASREAVDQVYAELTGAGYIGQQEPYDAFWGARYAIVEDPDGNAVGLMSPVDPARRFQPPAPPS